MIPSGSRGPAAPAGFADAFASRSLAPGREWPFFATPDGAPAFYAGRRGHAFGRIAGRPAEQGAPATRVALTRRGTGTVRIGSVRIVEAAQ